VTGLIWFLWSGSGHPSQRWRWVFRATLQASRCRIPSIYSTVWVSNRRAKRSKIGSRKPIYSPDLGNFRIKSCLTKW
jgi:hypothetical protein